MRARRTFAIGTALCLPLVLSGCGGAKAGTIQVTNDTASTVTVMECPPTGFQPGCPSPIGRQQLASGHTAKYAPVKCVDHCEPDTIVVINSKHDVLCVEAPPPDGKHSFLFLVTTLPGTDCDKYVTPSPTG